MAENIFVSKQRLGYYDEKMKAWVRAEDAKVLADAKAHAEGLGELYDPAGTAATKVQELADGQVKTNKEAIDKLNGDASTEGSVAKAIADAKAIIDADIDAVENKADAAQADADALETYVGTIPETAEATDIVGYIQEKTSGIATDTALEELTGRVADAEKDIEAIQTDYLKAADKTELTEAINTAKQEAISTVLGETVDADFDTLQEVAAWIQSDTTNSSALIARVSAIESDYLKAADKTALQSEIDALENLVGTLPESAASTTVVEYIQEVVDGLKIGDYAKASDLTALAARVTALEKDTHTHSNKDLLDTYTQTEESLADAVAKKHAHANATVLDGITSDKVTAWDSTEQNAKDYADELNAAMDNRVKTVEEKSTTNASDITTMKGQIASLEATTWTEISTDDIDSWFEEA